ncbi:formate dehydrogenase (quinone-dependent) catalytic subunit [Thiothrix eikelboomii]|uniref:Formate dehydrogenase (Quinone-dependent) catalytic subunit n=2 Tax=Thiothrix eikelboomii TaxID=92487 RepID=A0A1T4WC36_9GAMM|nr:formate dehydrogenase (quinone-dependent) catalytic subunit [Thiothrix eikelboomii]
MTAQMTRRQFFKVTAGGVASVGLGALGLSPEQVQAATRPFKLERTTEARNICPYCSVSCGVLMYSIGDKAKNVKAEIIHIEGDPDNPVNRGTLCPKGAGLLDMIHSPNRLKYPEVREAGTSEWKRISWDEAITRIATHMRADRDANFQAKNADGVTVNRWQSAGFLASSAASNEAGYLTNKVLRGLGMTAIDTQARI